MKKFLIGFGILALVCAAHIYFLFKNGYRPPPSKVMTPTQFAAPAEIGAALARRYWQELHSEQVVILGFSPFLHSGREIWDAFMRTAAERGAAFDRYFIAPSMPQIYLSKEPHKTEPFAWASIGEAIRAGQRILILQVSTDAMLAEVAENLPSGLWLFQSEFIVAKEAENKLSASCCGALEVSRRYYRKKLPADRLVAVLEKQGALKQILYVHEPSRAMPEAAGEQ